MGREVRRVPLDFEWPLREVWSGYLMPDELDGETCASCEGTGNSTHARMLHNRWYGYIPFDPAETGSKPFTPQTPAVRAFAERNVAHDPGFYSRYLGATGETLILREAQRLCVLWNGSWSHHLSQDDVDALVEGGRLHDFTHTWVQGDGWTPKNPAPVVTAEQVNIWSISGGGFGGHDSINAWVCIAAACARAGQPHACADCEGHGSREKYEGQRAEAEAWESTGPPTGAGWQLWETTSEGSPVSPVFATGEELAQWMSVNPCGFAGAVIPLETARRWVESDGWSLSLIYSPATGLQDGITATGGAR